MTNKNKRGVSPIIATVLLIVLTISMFLGIFTWSKSFIKEQVEKLGGPIETSCQGISYDAVLTGNSITATNKGNVVIYAFNVKAENAGTTKLKFIKTESGRLGIGEVDSLVIDNFIKNSERITVVPVLLGKGVNSGTGKLYVCQEQAKVVK